MAANGSDYAAQLWAGSAYADALHGVPRATGGNVLPTSEPGSSEFTDYLVGVAVLPGCIALIFLLWSFLLCCPCCRRCGATQSGGALLFLRFLFGALVVLSLGATAAAYLGSDSFSTGFADLLDASDGMSALFNDGLELADGATVSLRSAKVASDGIYNGGTPSYGCPIPITGMDGVGATLDEALGQLAEFDTAASGTVDLKDTIVEALEEGSGWRDIGTMVILGVLVACCVVFLVSVVLGTCDVEVECLLWSLSYVVVPLTLVMVLLVVACCVVYTVLAFVVADTCAVDPTATLLGQISAHSTAENYNITAYYSSCEGENPFTPTLGEVKSEVVATVVELNSLVVSNAAFFDTCADKAGLLAAFDVLIADLVAVEGSVDDAIAIVGCPGVNALYSKVVFDGVCGGVMEGTAVLFYSMASATLLYMASLTIRNVYQPGDEAFAQESDGTTSLQGSRGGGGTAKGGNVAAEYELQNTYGNDFV